MKRNIITKLLLFSGILSLILSVVLHLKTIEQVVWTKFLVVILAPSLLTLLLWVIILNSKINRLFKSKLETLSVSVKALLIILCVALMIFQFFVVSGWVMSLFEIRSTPTLMHFIGYFFLVGFVSTISMVYSLTQGRRQVQSSE